MELAAYPAFIALHQRYMECDSMYQSSVRGYSGGAQVVVTEHAIQRAIERFARPNAYCAEAWLIDQALAPTRRMIATRPGEYLLANPECKLLVKQEIINGVPQLVVVTTLEGTQWSQMYRQQADRQRLWYRLMWYQIPHGIVKHICTGLFRMSPECGVPQGEALHFQLQTHAPDPEEVCRACLPYYHRWAHRQNQKRR